MKERGLHIIEELSRSKFIGTLFGPHDFFGFSSFMSLRISYSSVGVKKMSDSD